MTNIRSTRGLTSTKQLDLKPIDHTQHAKFTPHPNCYEKFRTKLPKGVVPKMTRTGGMTDRSGSVLSPYQMMLEEMKEGANIARPTI